MKIRKKILTMGMITALLCSQLSGGLTWAETVDVPVLNVSKTASDIVLDGELSEKEWGSMQPLSHMVIGDQPDIDARFALTWDNENMYIGVEVKGLEGKTDFNSDSITYYMAPDNFRGKPYSSQDFQVQILDKGTRIKAGAQGVGKNDDLNVSDIKVKYKSQSNGYTMEIRMPWKVVGTMPKEDSNEMGFDIMAFSGEDEGCVTEWSGGNWIDTRKNGLLTFACDGTEGKGSIQMAQPVFEAGETVTAEYEGAQEGDCISIFKEEDGRLSELVISKPVENIPGGRLSFSQEEIKETQISGCEAGLAPGKYVAALINRENAVISTAEFEVGQVQIRTENASYEAAEKLPVKVSYMNTSLNDWVAIYEAGVNPDDSHPSIVWGYTKDVAQPDGTIVFDRDAFLNATHPDYQGQERDYLMPGKYKAVILENDSYTVKASYPFEVKAASRPSLSLDAAFYDINFNITVNYEHTTTSKDWIGIYKKGTIPSGNSEDAAYAYKYAPNGSGSVTFTWQDVVDYAYSPLKGEPLSAGDYQFILMHNDGYEILDTVDFTLTDQNQLAPPKAVDYQKESTRQGYADGRVIITPPDDTKNITSYSLYWADEAGKLADYDPVAVLKDGEKTYELVKNTYIPQEATRLIAYSSNGLKESDTCASFDLDDADPVKTGQLKTSFQVVSDIHVVTWEGAEESRFNQALKDMTTMAPQSKGIFIVGDMVDQSDEANYNRFDEIKSKYSKLLPPVYYAIGNHEYFESVVHPYEGNVLTCQEKAQRFLERTGSPALYYDTYIDGMHFIILGSEQQEVVDDDAYLSDEQFNWLEEKLAAPKNQNEPVFVFLHQSLADTIAGSMGGKSGQGWNGLKKDQDERLREILFKYPNVILFNGHSHWDMESPHEMYDGGDKAPSIFNTASVSQLWTDAQQAKEGSQGFYVEVYQDKLLVRGRNFATGKWIPGAAFVVDLSEKYVADKEKPVITGVEDQSVLIGEVFDPMAGVTATDNKDGDLTSKIRVTGQVDTTTTGSHLLIYSVSDAAGNTAEARRTIKVVTHLTEDMLPPVLTGVEDITIRAGVIFDKMAGVKAVDDRDGDITDCIIVTGDVRTTPGNYELTYSVSDSAGNETRKLRTVTVSSQSDRSNLETGQSGSRDSSGRRRSAAKNTQQPVKAVQQKGLKTQQEKEQEWIQKVGQMKFAERQALWKEILEYVPYTATKMPEVLNLKKLDQDTQAIINQNIAILEETGPDLRQNMELVNLVTDNTVTFKDVTNHHWAARMIMQLAQKGIVAGYPDGTFKPEETIKVADTCAFLDRVLLEKNVATMKQPRSIVEKYMTGQRNWAFYSEASIGSRLSEDTLEKLAQWNDQPLTRGFLAQLIYEVTDGSLKTDKKVVLCRDIAASEYKEALTYCMETGLLVGMPNGLAEPEKPLTRAELMAVLGRLESRY